MNTQNDQIPCSPVKKVITDRKKSLNELHNKLVKKLRNDRVISKKGHKHISNKAIETLRQHSINNIIM